MFTGLIKDIGTLCFVDGDGDRRARIKTGLDLATESVGASICCDGVCLTATSIGQNDDNLWVFDVDISAETCRVTRLGDWKEGMRVNLEPSLRIGAELGGHIVTGHVDTVGKLVSLADVGDSHRLDIRVARRHAALLVTKGSVTVDGVSLTVNHVEDGEDYCDFSVNIVPHTWEHTTLDQRQVGDTLNIEFDILARYLARMTDIAALDNKGH